MNKSRPELLKHVTVCFGKVVNQLRMMRKSLLYKGKFDQLSCLHGKLYNYGTAESATSRVWHPDQLFCLPPKQLPAKSKIWPDQLMPSKQET